MAWRRLLVLLIVLAIVGLPAVVLSATCAGNSCVAERTADPRVPFCPLPQELKTDLARGYREGRSPDVLAVASAPTLSGPPDASNLSAPWPWLGAASNTEIPLVFEGRGIDPKVAVPVGTGLDDVAPTVADAIGFDRPFPIVRSGQAVPGLAGGAPPRLVLEVALKGLGSRALAAAPRAWPNLRRLMRKGSGTMRGVTGSLPLDPAATLTTLGTGGVPSQHGITGTFVRNEAGHVVPAWGPGAPVSVIATLPDDWDEHTRQAAKVGLVATAETDRGLIGGTWYLDHDRDAVRVASGAATLTSASRILATGFGRDDVTDIMGVVLDATIGSMDRRLGQLVDLARRVSNGSALVVVAGTGAAEPGPGSGLRDFLGQIEAAVPGSLPVVERAVPGGLFLDQGTLTEGGITGQSVVDAALNATGRDGGTLMADAFQGFAVSFARYC